MNTSEVWLKRFSAICTKFFENGEGVRLIAPQDACKLQPFSQVYSHGNID
ncbi:unnamed protein product [Brassica oleracea]